MITVITFQCVLPAVKKFFPINLIFFSLLKLYSSYWTYHPASSITAILLLFLSISKWSFELKYQTKGLFIWVESAWLTGAGSPHIIVVYVFVAIQCVCLCSVFCQWYLVHSLRFEPKIEAFQFSHNYMCEVPVSLNPELNNLKIFVVFLLWYRCLYTDITEGDLFFDPKLGHLVSSSIVKLNFRRNITRSCESSLV